MKNTDEQLELAGQLQKLLLEDFLKLVKKGELSPTDRRTLYQMLKDGGWSLDPSRLPQDLRSKLTASSLDGAERPALVWDEFDEDV